MSLLYHDYLQGQDILSFEIVHSRLTADILSVRVNRQSVDAAAPPRNLILFDTKSFLTEQCGTPQNVLVLFSSYGLDGPSLWSVEKWWQRGSIAGQWLPSLLAVLELEHGHPVALAKYLK